MNTGYELTVDILISSMFLLSLLISVEHWLFVTVKAFAPARYKELFYTWYPRFFVLIQLIFLVSLLRFVACFDGLGIIRYLMACEDSASNFLQEVIYRLILLFYAVELLFQFSADAVEFVLELIDSLLVWVYNWFFNNGNNW